MTSLHAVTYDVCRDALDTGFVLHTPTAHVINDDVLIIDVNGHQRGADGAYTDAIFAHQCNQPTVLVDPSPEDALPSPLRDHVIHVKTAWIDRDSTGPRAR